MFDIGANLTNNQFKNDVKDVLINAKNNGIDGILLTSVDYQSLIENLSLIKTYSHIMFLKTTFGLHPHNSEKSQDIFQHIELLSNPEIISIGEFGLDYFRMIAKKETQQEVMHRFMDLAKTTPDKSLFLHERDAFEDFYSILKEHHLSNNSVVHCFGSGKDNMRKYLDLGCYIGFTGWISDHRRNQDVIEAIKYIPEDKILIETDAPYLTPFNMPNKPRRNEPAYLTYVLDSISEIKKQKKSELNQTILDNTKKFFKF